MHYFQPDFVRKAGMFHTNGGELQPSDVFVVISRVVFLVVREL